MAKTLKDIEFEFERQIAFAIHAATDDGRYSKIETTETEVSMLQCLAGTLCTLAYVSGMTKELFIDAVKSSWSSSVLHAEEAAAKIEDYLAQYQEALKEAGEKLPAEEDKEEKKDLKN